MVRYAFFDLSSMKIAIGEILLQTSAYAAGTHVQNLPPIPSTATENNTRGAHGLSQKDL